MGLNLGHVGEKYRLDRKSLNRILGATADVASVRDLEQQRKRPDRFAGRPSIVRSACSATAGAYTISNRESLKTIRLISYICPL